MRVIVFCILIGISTTTLAQHGRDKNDTQERREWMRKHLPYMSRTLGASFQSFDGINARVANLPQYKQLKDHAATIGLGWLQEHKQLVSAAAISFGSSMSGHRDEKSSTIRYIAVNIDFGYDVIKGDRYLLYPFAGLGAQAYQALFYRDNSAVNFNDVLISSSLQSNISSVKFKNSYGVYRLGIGFSVKAPKFPSSIGIQAGYTGSFKRNAWRSNEDQNLTNAPADRINQFYISLVLMSKPMFLMR
ncbi:MAG: hypothetical protein JSS70_02020 [Bacteroidetes bacterium]|nr:hypothetical protein [Bacteroidota bacterium]